MIRSEHLYCRDCGHAGAHRYDPDAPPPCPRGCGALRVDFATWDHGPATDVLGSARVSAVLSDASGRDLEYTSTRERDKKMREQGFFPAGDLVGGARTVVRPTSRPPRTAPARRGWTHGDRSHHTVA